MAEVQQPLAQADQADQADQAGREDTPAPGLLLRGVVRVRGHERALAKLAVAAGEELIELRGLAALVCGVPYRLPDWQEETIREHSRTIDRAMRRCTIVPAPYGIVFRSSAQVMTFLDEQHVALDEALSYLDGAFEIRLHLKPSDRFPGGSEGDQIDQAASFYSQLRRRSRAAFTLPASHNRILSAVFLVDRADWVGFVEQVDELDADHPEFQFDLTGPWPPYDFVRMTFLPRERSNA